jgi:hypothetical protein
MHPIELERELLDALAITLLALTDRALVAAGAQLLDVNQVWDLRPLGYGRKPILILGGFLCSSSASARRRRSSRRFR